MTKKPEVGTRVWVHSWGERLAGTVVPNNSPSNLVWVRLDNGRIRWANVESVEPQKEEA